MTYLWANPITGQRNRARDLDSAKGTAWEDLQQDVTTTNVVTIYSALQACTVERGVQPKWEKNYADDAPEYRYLVLAHPATAKLIVLDNDEKTRMGIVGIVQSYIEEAREVSSVTIWYGKAETVVCRSDENPLPPGIRTTPVPSTENETPSSLLKKVLSGEYIDLEMAGTAAWLWLAEATQRSVQLMEKLELRDSMRFELDGASRDMAPVVRAERNMRLYLKDILTFRSDAQLDKVMEYYAKIKEGVPPEEAKERIERLRMPESSEVSAPAPESDEQKRARIVKERNSGAEMIQYCTTCYTASEVSLRSCEFPGKCECGGAIILSARPTYEACKKFWEANNAGKPVA